MSVRRASLLVLLLVCTSTSLFAQAVVMTDMQIVKSGAPSPATVGQPITYTLLVTNAGPSTANGVTVTDVVPAGMTFVSANSTQGTCSGTVTVTCNIGTMNSLATATVTLVLTPTAPADYSNTATVAAAETDPNLANNTSTVRITAAAAPNPVPALSPLGLAGLAVLLAAAAMVALRFR